METKDFNTPLSEQLKPMQENIDQQVNIDNLRFKKECRKMALQSSERLNPVQTLINSQLGGLNDGKSKPSIESVLKDADKIYEWLIKDI